MKRLSTEKLAMTVKLKREAKGLTQEDLSDLTGINRVMIGRIERQDFIPSIQQFEALADALDFDILEMFTEKTVNNSFIALKSAALSEEEKESVDKFLEMILALRQQILLRWRFENGASNNA